MDTDCVLYELGTESLCAIYSSFIWRQGRIMGQVVIRQSLTAQKRIQPQARPHTVYSGQSVTGAGFCPNTSICPYHCDFTNSW
jgi:hypothetical protein